MIIFTSLGNDKHLDKTKIILIIVHYLYHYTNFTQCLLKECKIINDKEVKVTCVNV